MKRKFAKLNKRKGIYALSIVNAPAIRSNTLFLSEQKPLDDNSFIINLSEDAPEHFKFAADKKQKMIIGPVLIPGIDIPRRNSKGELFNLQFTAEEIAELNKKEHMNGYNNTYTLEHQVELKGVTQVENWIVRDAEKDISNVLGIPQKVGTLMRASYVDNETQFDDLALNFKGYSIEAEVDLEDEVILSDIEKQNTNKNINMKNNQGFFASLFSFKKDASKIKLADYPMEDGKVLTVDDQSGMATIDSNPATDGEYKLSDGSIAVISGGKLTDIMQPKSEDAAAQVAASTQLASTAPAAAVTTINAPAPAAPASVPAAPTTPVNADAKPADAGIKAPEFNIEDLKSELKKMQSMIDLLTKEKVKLEEEKLELSKKIRGEAAPVVLPNVPAVKLAGEKIKMSDLMAEKYLKLKEIIEKK